MRIQTSDLKLAGMNGINPLSAGIICELDQAMDYAARATHATVGEFCSAPRKIGKSIPSDIKAGIEAAVQFFVPPCCLEQFSIELDKALMKRSATYAQLRRSGNIPAIAVNVLPPGTFGQFRQTFKVDHDQTHQNRWSDDRKLIEGIVLQAQVGWRELVAIY